MTHLGAHAKQRRGGFYWNYYTQYHDYYKGVIHTFTQVFKSIFRRAILPFDISDGQYNCPYHRLLLILFVGCTIFLPYLRCIYADFYRSSNIAHFQLNYGVVILNLTYDYTLTKPTQTRDKMAILMAFTFASVGNSPIMTPINTTTKRFYQSAYCHLISYS